MCLKCSVYHSAGPVAYQKLLHINDNNLFNRKHFFASSVVCLWRPSTVLPCVGDNGGD